MWVGDVGRAHDIVGVSHKGLTGHPGTGNVARMWKWTTTMEGHGAFINLTAAEQHSFLRLFFICSL